MVKRSIDQKLRLRNLDAKNGRIESGAVVTSRKGIIGVEGGKGIICDQWKEKGQCSQGDRCSSRNDTQDRAQKPEPKAATVSEPSMSRSRSVSRKTSIRGESNQRSIFGQPCRYYLRRTCTRTSCEYWHPPECQFYKHETGCKAGEKCLFPYYKVEEQPNIKSQQELLPKKKRDSDDKNAAAIVRSVSQLGYVSQDSDALASQGRKSGKPDAESPGTNLQGTNH